MLFLWIFGNNVEDSSGPRALSRLLPTRRASSHSACQIAVDPNAVVPTIGASGAIAAVLGGYILLYPRARVLTLVFIVFFLTMCRSPPSCCSASGF